MSRRGPFSFSKSGVQYIIRTGHALNDVFRKISVDTVSRYVDTLARLKNEVVYRCQGDEYTTIGTAVLVGKTSSEIRYVRSICEVVVLFR